MIWIFLKYWLKTNPMQMMKSWRCSSFKSKAGSWNSFNALTRSFNTLIEFRRWRRDDRCASLLRATTQECPVKCLVMWQYLCAKFAIETKTIGNQTKSYEKVIISFMISGYFNRNCIHFWQRFDLVWMEQHFEQHYPVNWRLHFNSLDFNSITLWFHSSNSICEQFSYYFEFLYSFQSKMDLIFFLDWSVENFIIDFGTAMSKSPFNLR